MSIVVSSIVLKYGLAKKNAFQMACNLSESCMFNNFANEQTSIIAHTQKYFCLP